MDNKKIIVYVAVIFSIVCNVQGAIIQVGSTQNYTNILDALNDATDYDILQLDPETFSGLGNYQLDLSNKSITIAGNSSDSTIIDCQNLGRAFFAVSNDTIDLVFQDLTIQNCNAHGMYANESSSSVNLTAIVGWGGAFTLISNSSVQFINVRFITNYATQGGSIYIVSNHSVTIDNCYFFGSNSSQGAGLWIMNSPSVTITESQFENNRANRTGGAIWASASTFSIINSTFTRNVVTGGDGGAITFLNNAQVDIENSKFLNNSANNDGAAIYLNGGPDVVIHNSLFDWNFGGEGGAISCTDFASLDLFDCIFTNNIAQAWGGAVYFQQAIGTFQNSFVKSNGAQQGGGGVSIWNEGEVAIINSNFSENYSQRGGAFFLQYSSVLQVYNSSIQYNEADDNGGGIYCSDSILYLNESTNLNNNEAPTSSSTDLYCAEDIPYTYCKVHGVSNFTNVCKMPDEGGPSQKEYNTLIIIGAVIIGSAFLISCASFVIYFLDPDHRRQQGFYWSAFKEDDNQDDAVPLPE